MVYFVLIAFFAICGGILVFIKSQKEPFVKPTQVIPEPQIATSAQESKPQQPKSRWDTVLRIAALIMMVSFFVPMFSVSCSISDEEIEMSTFDIATGKIGQSDDLLSDFAKEYAILDASPVLFLIPLLAIGILVCGYRYKKLSLSLAIAHLLSNLAIYFTASYMVKDSYGKYCDFNLIFPFYIYLAIICGTIYILAHSIIHKNNQ